VDPQVDPQVDRWVDSQVDSQVKRSGNADCDAHMQAARDLASGMKRAGYRRRRAQRRQAGIAICRHLAASLRLQAEQEDRGDNLQ
jgi:hypothetical protein